MDVMTYDDVTHTYRVDGRIVPHVTGVIDFLAGYSGVPADVLEHARDRGQAVHLATQLDDEGDLDYPSLPTEIASYVHAWRKFRHDTDFSIHAIEERVDSARHHYAGRLDRIGCFGRLRHMRSDSRCLIDIKATAALMPTAGPQTAAYEAAWNEQYPKAKVKYRFVVLLMPDGDYKLIEQTEPTDWPVFLSALTLQGWMARHHIEGNP